MFAIVSVQRFSIFSISLFFGFVIFEKTTFFNYPIFVNVVKILNTVLPKKDFFITDQ